MEKHEEIEQLKKEKNEYLAGWKRAKADLINYKKEESERQQKWGWVIRAEFASKILPALDSLDRAEQSMKGDKGFVQIAKQLRKAFREQGIEEIKAQGDQFNPELHEAVQEVQILAAGGKAGQVVEVVEKGYAIEGYVLRPAKVKITK